MFQMPQTLRSRRHQVLVAVIIEGRKAARLTQTELAVKIRLSQSGVAAIESGQRRIDIIEFLDIAKAIGVEPGVLFRRVLRRI